MYVVMELLVSALIATWGIILESAVFILLGFIVAGFIKGFMPVDKIARYLGPRNLRSVGYASLFGIPLPLCSCGVLPTAMALHKQGANKGATTAFLISTPETGVDSIAITYALMDPVMTIFRPFAAFVTAMMAGVSELIFGQPESETAPAPKEQCSDGCGEHNTEKVSILDRLNTAVEFAFNDLMKDMAGWMMIGFFFAGLITTLMPDDFLLRFSDSVFTSMLLMLIAGIPLYICATASTPIAAALILKGLNPGAALVFLLAGPATNSVSIALLYKLMGRNSVIVYLVSICVSSILLGYMLNSVYHLLGIQATALSGAYTEIVPVYVEFVTALILSYFIIRVLFQKTASMYRLRFAKKAG